MRDETRICEAKRGKVFREKMTTIIKKRKLEGDALKQMVREIRARLSIAFKARVKALGNEKLLSELLEPILLVGKYKRMPASEVCGKLPDLKKNLAAVIKRQTLQGDADLAVLNEVLDAELAQ